MHASAGTGRQEESVVTEVHGSRLRLAGQGGEALRCTDNCRTPARRSSKGFSPGDDVGPLLSCGKEATLDSSKCFVTRGLYVGILKASEPQTHHKLKSGTTAKLHRDG